MTRKSLKNFDKYLLSLRVFAKAIKIKLQWKTDPFDGAYIPSRRSITVDPDLEDTETLATILHEIGHMLDFHVIDGATADRVFKSYGVIYTEKYSDKNLHIVRGSEVRAWRYGSAVAKILDIPLGTWYKKEEKSALLSYKRLTKTKKNR